MAAIKSILICRILEIKVEIKVDVLMELNLNFLTKGFKVSSKHLWQCKNEFQKTNIP